MQYSVIYGAAGWRKPYIAPCPTGGYGYSRYGTQGRALRLLGGEQPILALGRAPPSLLGGGKHIMVGKPLTINELAALPRWVAWQNEPDPTDPARAPRKRPYSPKGGSAKADDPATWGTRREAETAAEKLPMPLDAGGTGFELGDIGNGLSIGGIDLDTCRDEDSGAFTPWAAEVLLKFSSYAEVSPSGHGAKIFFAYATADLPAFRQAMGGTSGRRWSLPGTNNHPPGIEIYLAGRYFAVTYARVDSTPIEIKTIDTATVLWVINDAGPRLVPAQPAISTASRDNSRSDVLSP